MSRQIVLTIGENGDVSVHTPREWEDHKEAPTKRVTHTSTVGDLSIEIVLEGYSVQEIKQLIGLQGLMEKTT